MGVRNIKGTSKFVPLFIIYFICFKANSQVERIEYGELTAKCYCKCMKCENVRALLRLAVTNKRLIEHQAEFFKKEFGIEINIT